MRKQAQRVLDYIEQFGSITSLDAFKDLGITRLSAVIFDLRREGHNVLSETISAKNRFGEIAHFSKYYIPKEAENVQNHNPNETTGTKRVYCCL